MLLTLKTICLSFYIWIGVIFERRNLMAKIYYEKDADLKYLKGKTIAVIGYGSQGHAHALNLKESGQNVIVGLRKGSDYWNKAKGSGLKVETVSDAVKKADIIMMLIPDTKQREVFENKKKPNQKRGNAFAFPHGLNTPFGQFVHGQRQLHSPFLD